MAKKKAVRSDVQRRFDPAVLDKKKPNPQDATLRNIRALKKRVTDLETSSTNFGDRLAALEEIERPKTGTSFAATVQTLLKRLADMDDRINASAPAASGSTADIDQRTEHLAMLETRLAALEAAKETAAEAETEAETAPATEEADPVAPAQPSPAQPDTPRWHP